VSPRATPLRLAIAIAVTAAVLAFLWSPPPPQPRFVIPHFDKLIHFALFTAIAIAWQRTGLSAPWLLALGIVLGIVTELVQGWLPWPRTPDAWDVVADTLGLAVVVAVARWRQPPHTEASSLP
jgi:VanZ family protein